MQASGVKDVAQLIGSRWSSQSPDNFILVFNGNPIYESVLKLTHIFQCIFGANFALTLARGYTRVVMNSIPTLWNNPSDPLPSTQSLQDKLDRNDSCQNMIIFGDPYWLMARMAGAHHGSISFAFLDEDGSKLQRLIQNPPFLFGNRTTKVHKYISHPLLLECMPWPFGTTLLCALHISCLPHMQTEPQRRGPHSEMSQHSTARWHSMLLPASLH